jgi:hypothetical protein
MSSRSSPWSTRRLYEFIKAHRREFEVQTMCRALDINPSGFYAWLKDPLSNHAKEDACVFRSMPATSSGACRAMIPVHVGPPFRSMPAGGCDAG